MKNTGKISSFFSRFRRSTTPDRKKPRLRNHASTRYGGMGERELQLRMELILENFISDKNYQTLDTAKQLSRFSLSEQERFCKAAERLVTHSPKLAYHFFLGGVPAITTMNDTEWSEWLGKIETTMHEQGENAAINYLQNLDTYLSAIASPPHTVNFEKIAPVIEHFVTALGGRQLKSSQGEEIFTDTEWIFLPEKCSLFSDKEKNFNFYKSVAVFLWAQTRYGTWQIDMAKLLYDFADHSKSLNLFQILENLRLDACITRELPGIGRTLDELGRQAQMLPDDDAWLSAAHRLERPDATAHDSLEMIKVLYLKPSPQTTVYQGVFKPRQVMRAIKRRTLQERSELQERLSELIGKTKINHDPDSLVLEQKHAKADIYQLRFSNDGEEIETTPEVQKLLESIKQDQGEIPRDYLRLEKNISSTTAQRAKPTQEPDRGILLPEWDHSIRRYRADWCQIFFREIPGKTSDFVDTTLKQHRGLVRQLRRSFEALRNEDALSCREPYGDDIDIDAAIAAFIDFRRSEEPNAGVYLRRKKSKRNIAAAFIVDMSASTKGWINETEKKALVLLCESLEKIGDRYAIYGFSGRARKRCDIFKIKSFDESYDNKVKSRIGEIAPQEFTRMGAAIRFVCSELTGVEAKNQIMISLSDGRPDDVDGYRGRYGIEDTRRALLETSFKGIHPYCITIDTKAADYLPYMYGRSNFSIVDQIEKLPFQVSDIYRRVTT